MVTKCPEWIITQDEAKKLAKSLAEVLKHYKLLNSVSPKTAAFIQLLLVCGAIYVPKAMQIGKRKKHEREQAQSENTFNVDGSAVMQ